MADNEAAEKKPDVAEEKKPVNGASTDLIVSLLRHPVRNGDGEQVSELRFREPNAGDIEACGNPVILDLVGQERPKVNFDAKSMTQMMARLAAVPPSSIRQMHPKDWNTAAWMLTNFFMPDL
jgi:hypothetical protein